MNALRKLIAGYMLSLLFLIWSALCVSAGAAVMYAAIKAELSRRGLV